MSKQVILTGLRANNDLHIGNYFGALMPIVDMAKAHADQYEVDVMVADLHSFTTSINFRELHGQIAANLKAYAAAGLPLDNSNVRLFRQSYVPAHSELTWILDCFTGMGEMSRMTQFKDKSSKMSEERINVGLFNYPVLMACDYLLYNANYVPVGEDQTQHLEFGRDIAMRLNKQFDVEFPNGLLTVPFPVAKQHEFFGKDQGLRIRDLQNPTKKMSKSDESGKGVVFLSDAPEVASKKIMSAETDSVGTIPARLDFEQQPGISNLLQMLALLNNQPAQDVVVEWAGNTSYGDLKKAVADKVSVFLSDYQERLSKVDELALQTKLEASEIAMNETANATLLKVQQAVGLRPLK